MALVVNHNLMAMNAARNLGSVYNRLATSTQRLSSGLRVNSAADDAAGLAIRELMRSDIKVLNQGIRNAGDAISLIQTAEGALSVIDEKLIRMKELAEQAATGTYTTAQREIMNSEYQAMAAEIDRIANATDFNGVKLLDGSLKYSHEGSGMKIHFGVGNDTDEDYYYISMGDMRATQATGLRVGNTDLQDTLRTTKLNATSATSYLNSGLGNTAGDGYFGIRYSTDFNTESTTTAAASTWNIYGYVKVDASADSINSLVQEINKGRQATGQVAFQHAMTTLTGEAITINGQVFTFSTADFGAGTYTNGIGGAIGVAVATASAVSVTMAVAAYINDHAASIGVYAVPVSGATSTLTATTVHLFATAFGETGNLINVASATTLMAASQTYLQNGGEKTLSASAYFDAANGDYELQIQMNHGGERYQVQTFTMVGNQVSRGVNSIVGGSLTSVPFTYGDFAPTSGYATLGLAAYGQVNASTEWDQAQNGSGRTLWDGADILTQSAAQEALAAMDAAINKKDTARANLGAIQNRLQNTITNLQIQAENLQAAESRISDVDVATEMTEFTRNNILAQAAVAMLAQANSLPQLALQLLGG